MTAPERVAAPARSGWLGARFDSALTFLLSPRMRTVTLLFGLSLAFPALGAPPERSDCRGMTMPPENLTYVSRGFGRGHTGIDLMAPYGTPIRAAAGGTVEFAGWYFAYGRIVDIRHTDGLITRYAHMSEIAADATLGAPVAAGAVIGRVCMTGRAHGPHVHFEVRVEGRAVDPRPYLALGTCIRPAQEPLQEARAPEDHGVR